jgi:hypothetical protein
MKVGIHYFENLSHISENSRKSHQPVRSRIAIDSNFGGFVSESRIAPGSM